MFGHSLVCKVPLNLKGIILLPNYKWCNCYYLLFYL